MLTYSRRALLESGAAAMGALFLDGVARAQEPADSGHDHAWAFFGSTSVALASPGIAAGAQKDDGDPIDAHLLREATRHARNLRQGTQSHETIAGIASNLRLHAAHVRSTKLEPKLAKALSRQVARRGRKGFLDDVTGPEVMQRHHDQLRAFGLEDLHVPEREIPREQYDRMIATLSTPGALAGMLDQSADVFDDLNARGVLRVVKAQDIGGYCQTMTTICQFMREAVAIICALSGAFPELLPVCAVMGVEAATACFLAWAGGC